MSGQNPLIAMKDVAVLVPDTEIEVSLYAAFCHGLGDQWELNLEQRAALATALETFRAAYHGAWVDGTAFVTRGEAVFIPAVAWRAGHPEALAVRVPPAGDLDRQLPRPHRPGDPRARGAGVDR
jgi:hypothetical protein